MARVNRRKALADGEIQVVHFVNRCVRRGFLCGKDPLTCHDDEHRRFCVRRRLSSISQLPCFLRNRAVFESESRFRPAQNPLARHGNSR